MVSFRKALLLLAVLVLVAGTVSAQIVNCTTRATPTIMRSEGLTEEAGRVEIRCEGLTPGQPIGPVTFRMFTAPWQITSKLVSGSMPTGTLEAALLIGQPTPATLGSTAFLATPVPGTVASDGTVTAIEWTIPTYTPPGTTLTLNIVNVRINATPAGQTISPVPVNATIAVTGSGLPTTSSTPTIGYIQRGIDFSAVGTTTVNQCDVGSSTTFNVRFRELLPNALRVQSSLPGNQDNLSVAYNTESMYYPISGAPGNPGLATNATQVALTFSSLPSGTTYTAPGSVTSGGTTLTLTSAPNANPVIYTVTASSTGTYESFTIPITVNFTGQPPLGTITVTASLFPGGGNTPVATNVPRFTTAGAGTGSLNIQPCETRLLFPFLTSEGGFDTGVAIANTSKDPFSTPNQSGACTLHFYRASDGSALTPQTSNVVPAGGHLVFTLSGGGGGISALPNYTGYMIARCNFQYAHGYAFISDLGASKLAQGYLALVLANPFTTPSITNAGRYGSTPVEALNQ
jgi:hypothetical protein